MDSLHYNAYSPKNYDYNALFEKSSTPTSSDGAKSRFTQKTKEYLQFKKLQETTLSEFGVDAKLSESKEERKQLIDKKESSVSKTNLLKWISNGVTAVCNLGKTLIGVDPKTGKWDSKKCLRNVVITAAAVGACFIPYVGPFIGYSLLVAGAISGGIGIYNGSKALYNAKTSEEIDNAQQDIWANALMTAGSVIGLRGIGASFRTAAATSSKASAASAQSGKVVQAISNFGRDVTVNAWRSTKLSAEMSALQMKNIGTLDKIHRFAMKDLRADIEGRLSGVNARLSTETDSTMRIFLEEQKSFLEANLAEFNKVGPTIKSRAEFENLLSNSSSSFNREWLNTAYTKNAAGNYEINGQTVSAELFDAFRKTNLSEQAELNAKLYKLVKIKDALMKKYAANPAKYSRQLNKYVDITDVSKNSFNPSNWFKNEYQIALSSKSSTVSLNPIKFYTKPASTPIKFMTLTEPMHSESVICPASATNNIADDIKLVDEKINILNKLKSAISKEDFEKAMEEYNALESKYAEIVAKSQQESARQIATA